jgi:DNA-binding PadR family transcriptional regulator
MATNSPDREWKKGSAEFLVLLLLEGQPRHGYDISKPIQILALNGRAGKNLLPLSAG